jgi:hypothetical protein
VNNDTNTFEYTLENTAEAINNGQSREAGNIQDKQNNTTHYVLDTTMSKQTQIT